MYIKQKLDKTFLNTGAESTDFLVRILITFLYPLYLDKISALSYFCLLIMRLSGWKIWRNSFFLGAIPVIILGHINAFGLGEEHERPEFKPYDHLRIRTKVLIIYFC